jgi:hypothetical protein
MICRKCTKERNLYPNHGYGKKLIAETSAMRKMGKHMNTCMQACRHTPILQHLAGCFHKVVFNT